MPASNRYRLSLKSLLLGVIYFCIGLMASIKPGAEAVSSPFSKDFVWLWLLFEVAIQTIACALIPALLSQTKTLFSWKPIEPNVKATRRLAIFLRWIIAATLLAGLSFRMAVTQQWISDPRDWNLRHYWGIQFTDSITWLSVFAAIYLNHLGQINQGRGNSYTIFKACWGLACLIIAVAALTHFLIIAFMTYKSLEEMHHGTLSILHRPWAYPLAHTNSYKLFWAACGGMVSLLLGVAITFRSLFSSPKRFLHIALGTLLLMLAAAYGYWFFTVAGPVQAPDFAEAGLQSRWRDWLEAAVILGPMIPLAAYRLSEVKKQDNQATACVIELRFPLQLPLIAIGALGGIAGLMHIFLSHAVNFGQFSQYRISWQQQLFWLLADLESYLPVALTLVFLQLMWKSLRCQELQSKVPLVDEKKFAWTCMMLVVLIPVAIPTITAFSFSMWLSPWMS